jgi:hypothetical protein
LIDAGLDESLAVGAGLSMLVLVCWFICAKIEPTIRGALGEFLSNVKPRAGDLLQSSKPYAAGARGQRVAV